MPSSTPSLFQTGPRLIDGNDLNAAFGAAGLSQETGVTAFASGGKANATPVTGANIKVSTVATAADSILLPPAKAGLRLAIRNSGAASMQVFGQGIDTINAVATATGVAQANGVSALYFCPVDGEWFRILSA